MKSIPKKKLLQIAKLCILSSVSVWVLGKLAQAMFGIKHAPYASESYWEREILEDEGRIIPGVGQNGIPLQLDDPVNVSFSDRIAYNRTFRDFRNPDCLAEVYDAELPSTSIIVVFHNEIYSVLLRLIWGIIGSVRRDNPVYQNANFYDKRTGKTMQLGYKGQSEDSQLLYVKEIILVDDNSTMYELKGKLDYYVKTRFPQGLVKIVRLPAQFVEPCVTKAFICPETLKNMLIVPGANDLARDYNVSDEVPEQYLPYNVPSSQNEHLLDIDYSENMDDNNQSATSVPVAVSTDTCVMEPPIEALNPENNLIPTDAQPADPSTMDIPSEILEILGEPRMAETCLGKSISTEISKRWGSIISEGLQKDTKKNLMDKILVPENFQLAQAPKLNPEISAILNVTVKNRDKRLEKGQNQLGTAISSLANLVSELVHQDLNKIEIIKKVSETSLLLLDLHYEDTVNRRNLLTPLLDSKFTAYIQNIKRDGYLFGENLSGNIKTSKNIEKSSQQIKKPTYAIASTSRAPFQGNGQVPPRQQYPRQPVAPPRRQPAGAPRYPAPAPQARNYNASATRRAPQSRALPTQMPNSSNYRKTTRQ